MKVILKRQTSLSSAYSCCLSPKKATLMTPLTDERPQLGTVWGRGVVTHTAPVQGAAGVGEKRGQQEFGGKAEDTDAGWSLVTGQPQRPI